MFGELHGKPKQGALELVSDHAMAESLRELISSKFASRFGEEAKLVDVRVRKYPEEFSAVAFLPPDDACLSR